MDLWLDIAIGAVGGAALGAIFGFVVAVVTLTARRLQNRRLVKRSEPPRKHLVLPRYHLPGAAIGLVAGAVAVPLTSTLVGLAIAAVAPIIAWLLAMIIALALVSRD